MFCILGMKGTPPCLRAVDALLSWCAERDCELEVVWYPRSTGMQQQADALSKHPDMVQWSLRQDVYESLWSEPCLAGRRPNLDAFADEATTKVPGRFYSARWSPNSLGVDALAQKWEAPVSSDGSAPLLYINPPFELMGRVVRKLREEQPDCVVIVLRWPRWWVNHLRAMPHYRGVRALPGMHLFTSRALTGQVVEKTPRYAVDAWFFVH